MLKAELLASKWQPPPPPTHHVARPHLVQQLRAGLDLSRPLTLVSAPAGFGKTSCVWEWLREPAGGLVAWLSLDPSDDDPVRFFAYLIGALQTVSPGIGQEIAGVLQAGQLPPAEVLSTALINDLLDQDEQRAGPSEERFLLVLDDFHVIQDPSILQVVEQLLDNLPSPWHLVLITREDPLLPLARLRANNRLTEIRADDLRFRTDEAECFLNEALALSLSATDVGRLEEKTEGWVAGLQLAALALQGSLAARGTVSVREPQSSSQFIDALSGSHRYILDYLTEQVLDRQPPEIRHFLLHTAILERLNGNLCNAVTGRADSHSMLERLFNANLFLVPLDGEGQWYRYHHLFADLLRSRHGGLPKENVADLHLRASQ